jgi:hypothetical protein
VTALECGAAHTGYKEDMVFYRDLGRGAFESTAHTEGPWSPGAQHAGPPSALLTRAVEQVPTTLAGEARIVRIAFDILGSVPVAPVRVRAATVRPGRTVELVEATLEAGDRTVMQARAWRVRRADEPLTVAEAPAGPPVHPDTLAAATPTWPGGYLKAVEWRFVDGRFGEPGPARVWARLLGPVVDGESPSALQRAVAVADSGNGLSGLLDPTTFWFINTELTVHLVRPPVGDWIHVDAVSRYDAGGSGVASTELSDLTGRFGSGAQALLVAPR